MTTTKLDHSFGTLVGADLHTCVRPSAPLRRCPLLISAISFSAISAGILALSPSVFAAEAPSVPAFPGAP